MSASDRNISETEKAEDAREALDKARLNSSDKSELQKAQATVDSMLKNLKTRRDSISNDSKKNPTMRKLELEAINRQIRILEPTGWDKIKAQTSNLWDKIKAQASSVRLSIINATSKAEKAPDTLSESTKRSDVAPENLDKLAQKPPTEPTIEPSIQSPATEMSDDFVPPPPPPPLSKISEAENLDKPTAEIFEGYVAPAGAPPSLSQIRAGAQPFSQPTPPTPPQSAPPKEVPEPALKGEDFDAYRVRIAQKERAAAEVAKAASRPTPSAPPPTSVIQAQVAPVPPPTPSNVVKRPPSEPPALLSTIIQEREKAQAALDQASGPKPPAQTSKPVPSKASAPESSSGRYLEGYLAQQVRLAQEKREKAQAAKTPGQQQGPASKAPPKADLSDQGPSFGPGGMTLG